MSALSGKTVGDVVRLVRAKNAGPFRVTIDVFCGDTSSYISIRDGVTAARVAAAFQLHESKVQRFELPSLAVIKFSLSRPCVQGAREDRDMHGAQWAVLVTELQVEPVPVRTDNDAGASRRE